MDFNAQIPFPYQIHETMNPETVDLYRRLAAIKIAENRINEIWMLDLFEYIHFLQLYVCKDLKEAEQASTPPEPLKLRYLSGSFQ